jgi:murein DD-endopeptidase MepM/ murein hydrolase activator NlpD
MMHPSREGPVVTTRRTLTRAVTLGGLAALLAVPMGLSNPPQRASAIGLRPAALVLSDGDGGLPAKKKKIAAALATAQATYEAAGTKVQAAAEAYAQASAELPDAQADLAEANGAVIAASVGVDQAKAKVVTAQVAVTTSDSQLTAAEVKVDSTRAAISSIAVTAYEGSNLTTINVLMNPGSPTDVLTRLSLLDQMAQSQNAALDGYVAARAQAKDAYNQTVATRTAAERARKAATAALTKSQNAKSAAQAATESVTQLVAATKTALGVAQQNKAATLAAFNQLEAENNEVTKQLAAQARKDTAAAHGKPAPSSHSGPVTGTSGYFIMPVHGWESSPFGMRFDPFYKRWQLHAGVDIAAGGGTPIHAAGSGRVIRAGWDGGYGNYTCIDNGIYNGPGAYHGKDVATCYGHQSKILVHVGQHVSAGQTIGRVGETGAATGYHLHFEVRINGTPIQPVSWLPKCFC